MIDDLDSIVRLLDEKVAPIEEKYLNHWAEDLERRHESSDTKKPE
jgi:hypothetical protein